MIQGEKKQTRWMRSVLFWIIVVLFAIISILTNLAFFTNLMVIPKKYAPILFKIFILQFGITVFSLVREVFNMKKKSFPKVVEKPAGKVDGKNKYEIICSDNKTTYQDECVVKQYGRALAVNGEQTKVSHVIRKKKISFHWFSLGGAVRGQ